MKPYRLLSSTALAAMLATYADAGLLSTPIDNADFEAQATSLNPSNFLNGITAWATFVQIIAGAPNPSSFVQWEGSSTDFHPEDDDGIVWGGIGSATGAAKNPNSITGIYQQIGTYTGSETINVALKYSFRDDRQWRGFKVTLFTSDASTATGGVDDTLDGTNPTTLAGYTLLSSVDVTVSPTANAGGPNTRPSVVPLTVNLPTGGTTTPGKPIWVSITALELTSASQNQQVFLDDFVVTATPDVAEVPPAITAFDFDSTGVTPSSITFTGTPGTPYIINTSPILDFSVPNPVTPSAVTVGTLSGNQITPNVSGDASAEFTTSGTANFFRVEKAN